MISRANRVAQDSPTSALRVVRYGPALAALVGAVIMAGCIQKERVSLSEDRPWDAAVIFQLTATVDDVTSFVRNDLTKPAAPDREGIAHLDGVQIVNVWRGSGIVLIDFHDDATVEERTAVLQIVEQHPLVDRVELDVVPSSLPARTLDELRQE